LLEFSDYSQLLTETRFYFRNGLQNCGKEDGESGMVLLVCITFLKGSPVSSYSSLIENSASQGRRKQAFVYLVKEGHRYLRNVPFRKRTGFKRDNHTLSRQKYADLGVYRKCFEFIHWEASWSLRTIPGSE